MTNAADKIPTIIQILPALISGGVERGTVDMVAAIAAVGWRPVVISAGGPMVREVERAGGIHIQMPVNKKSLMGWWRMPAQLRRIIKEQDAAIVHARSRWPAWLAWRALRTMPTVKFVTTFHGTYNFHNQWKKRYNSIMTRGDRVIAISHFIAEHMQNNYMLDAEKITVIHRGIDLVKFNPDATAQDRVARLMQESHIPEHKPIILMPGRYTRWKGQFLLLDALVKIIDQDWYCVMMGSQHGHEKYLAELERAIELRGLAGRIRLLPDTRDMAAAYQMADVVVCPSTDPEAFGRVPVEAQAMGRMVIASNHGGAAETILIDNDDERTGWLFENNNADDLAKTITTVLHQTAFSRFQIGTRARSHVAAHFTKDKMCADTLHVYADLMGYTVHDTNA